MPHSEVLWAQRSHATDPAKNTIRLTINVPSLQTPTVNLTTESLTVKAPSDDGQVYETNIDFYAAIDTDNSDFYITGSSIVFHLRKEKQQEEYWPRLTKEKVKLHWLKTDFEHWVDEDEQDEAPEPETELGGLEGFGGGNQIDLSALEGLQGLQQGLDRTSSVQEEDFSSSDDEEDQAEAH